MIDQDYTNQNILLTGAASGIGFCQAQTYLAAGARVWGIDQAPIAIDHPNFTAIQQDLRRTEEVSQLGQGLAANQTFDILLNTAGVLDGFQPTLAQSLADFEQILSVDLLAAVTLTNAVLPGMLARKSGQVVNMASIAGFSAGGGGAAYTASKHALIGYTKQLAFDYASQGIRANAIAPGAIKTPMNVADFAGDGQMAKSVAENTPAKRWAKPQEVADLTLYLTSPQASYINGAVLTMDGGWTLGH
ncbi:3-oxoacyl-ACP reductase [Lactobacillaceae bacterium L1_55_11]|nr:3-oxoacyl-ACP reductase [Lactobacillaceae bacterium L1_55_11]